MGIFTAMTDLETPSESEPADDRAEIEALMRGPVRKRPSIIVVGDEAVSGIYLPPHS